MPLNTNRWNRLRYTLYAPVYDRVARFASARRRAIALLELHPGERVLIVGAGTGGDLPYLPPGVSVTAVDLTPAMVERAQRRAARLGLPLDARVMDAHALDFPDATFDAVVLHLILAVVPDPVACASEAARVLRPGGRASVFDKFVGPDTAPSAARRALNLLTNALFSDITRRLEPLLADTGLAVVRREPGSFGGRFEIALLRKHGPA